MKKKTVKQKKPQAVVVPEQNIVPIESMVFQAIEKGLPVETMERILKMKKDWDLDQAKKAFDEAMAKAQAEFPIIKRIKEGSRTRSGQIAFKYAPLEVIVKQVSPILSNYGLSFKFDTIFEGDNIKVVCIAKHSMGHSDESSMVVENSGGTSIMSKGQIAAANVTFAKRYAFTNMFGIVTEEEDNEQTLYQSQPRPQIKNLKQMIKDAKLTEKSVLDKFKVDAFEELDNKNLLILEKSLNQKLGNDYIPVVK